jgi:hypothetical protein
MANSNKVFVSPGVYTSEKDLTFVAQSVGVTTLGLVGETLKGPAFEPILISNFDEFKNYFGPTSPAKDVNGNPKYELGYVAKSYLQESNQLFVTRVLGLTGYKPYKTFGIKTIGGVILEEYVDAGDFYGTSGLTPTNIGINDITEIYDHLSIKPAYDGTMITDYIVKNFSGYSTGQIGNWFVLGKVPTAEIADINGLTPSKEVKSPLTGKLNASNSNTKEWYNVLYKLANPNDETTVNGVYSYLFVWRGSKFDVTRYNYDAMHNTDYDAVVVGSVRSRGHYSGQTLVHEVTGNTSFTLTEVGNMKFNPMGEFTINVTGHTGGHKEFTCTFDMTSSKFISKVLGTDVFDKDYSNFPVYVHEVYSNLVKSAYERGLIRGLSMDASYELEGDNYLHSWDTTISPMVVSEVRGGEVADLFQVITISDGEAANFQVKITVQNINLDTAEFDLLVRDFNDTDDNQVFLEKY